MASVELKPLAISDNALKELEALIKISWYYDYHTKGFFYFKSDFLKHILTAPNIDTSLQIAAYENDKLIGFNASLPRTLSYNKSKILKTSILTYLSVHPEYRRRGIGSKIIKKAIELQKEKGYALSLAYFDCYSRGKLVYNSAQSNMAELFVSNWLCKILGFTRFMKAIGFEYLAQYLDNKFKFFNINKSKSCTSNVRIYKDKESDILQILDVFNSYQYRLSLARVWSLEELKWYLENPYIKTFVFDDENKIRGVISYIEYVIWLGKRYAKIAFFDEIHISNLRFADARVLINAAAQHGYKADCVAAIVPRMRYFKEFPFLACGFIPYTRKFEFYAVLQNIQKLEIASPYYIYIDVK